jgi:hypothetical protein
MDIARLEVLRVVTMKIFLCGGIPYILLWEAIHPPQEVKATEGQKPVHYCAKKPATTSKKKETN